MAQWRSHRAGFAASRCGSWLCGRGNPFYPAAIFLSLSRSRMSTVLPPVCRMILGRQDFPNACLESRGCSEPRSETRPRHGNRDAEVARRSLSEPDSSQRAFGQTIQPDIAISCSACRQRPPFLPQGAAAPQDDCFLHGLRGYAQRCLPPRSVAIENRIVEESHLAKELARPSASPSVRGAGRGVNKLSRP